MSFKHTVIVVSHDRHFLDRVCTHVADVDFQKVTLFTGNYSFWYQSSQLALRLRQESNRRKEDQIKDLKAFVQRFSANASKSRQATSRKVQLDKITLDDIRPSSRRYPFIAFETERELGKDVLVVDGISKTLDGEVLFRNLSFMLTKGEKMALTGNDLATTTLLQVLAGEVAPDTGQVRWGRTANLGYFPKDNAGFFDTDLNIIEWLRRVSANQEETYVRAFLGRMLFSGEASKKSAQVLSGGEKVRCMISRLMLQDPNVLLLDGPTNHLDLESITAFNNGLLKFTGSLVLSSHDVQFVDSLVTRVIELAGEKHYDLDMTYEEYLADPARYARGGTLEGRAA
jgi:ATPase subunit of ABC transporter with duplicated ATPase domains